jgi:hypothetical protein
MQRGIVVAATAVGMNSSSEGSKFSNYAPSLFAFSPDDRCLTFLHAASANDSARQLWAADMDSLR